MLYKMYIYMFPRHGPRMKRAILVEDNGNWIVEMEGEKMHDPLEDYAPFLLSPTGDLSPEEAWQNWLDATE